MPQETFPPQPHNRRHTSKLHARMPPKFQYDQEYLAYVASGRIGRPSPPLLPSDDDGDDDRFIEKNEAIVENNRAKRANLPDKPSRSTPQGYPHAPTPGASYGPTAPVAPMHHPIPFGVPPQAHHPSFGVQGQSRALYQTGGYNQMGNRPPYGPIVPTPSGVSLHGLSSAFGPQGHPPTLLQSPGYNVGGVQIPHRPVVLQPSPFDPHAQRPLLPHPGFQQSDRTILPSGFTTNDQMTTRSDQAPTAISWWLI